MPSVIPGFVYSLFAALIVGSIVVCTCSIAASSIKADADVQQLSNIAQYAAAQGLTLLSHTTQENQNTTQYLDVPSQVGNQIFWIRIANDSSTAWVEAGFGATVTSSNLQVTMPAKVAASGSFISGSGRAALQCRIDSKIPTLILTQE